MRKDRVQKVWAEIHRTIDAIKAMDESNQGDRERYGSSAKFYGNCPKESGAVRRASMDLTRALAVMRRSDYDKRD